MTTKSKSWFYCLFTQGADSSKRPLCSWGSTRFTLQAAVSFWYQGIFSFILGSDQSLVSHTSPLSGAAFLTRIPTLPPSRVNSSYTLPTAHPLARALPTCSEGCPFHSGDQHPPTHTSWGTGRATDGLPRDSGHTDTRLQLLKHTPVPYATDCSSSRLVGSARFGCLWSPPVVMRLREPRPLSYVTALPQN